MTTRIRLGAFALGLGGLLFMLYEMLRPWHDETTVEGALASMGSPAWVLSHFLAMAGFILVPLGLLAVRQVLGATRSEAAAFWAFVIATVGSGLVLPYYGAEDFGLYAVANSPGVDILAIAESVRYQPLAMTIFGTGLVLLAVAGVMTAAAVWRSGVLPRFSAVLFAVTFVLFLPQFFTPAAVRIGFGVLALAAHVWLAWAVFRRADHQ
jgi:hypothetical protein